MNKKIFFNALAYSSSGAGISKYTQKLSNQYLRDYENIWVLGQDKNLFEKKSENLIICNHNIKNSKKRIITEQLLLNEELKKYDLIHYPDYSIPIFTKVPAIATIHDMSRLAMPEMWTDMQKLTAKFFMSETIKKAKKIICISEFTAREVMKFYPNIDENKLEVVLQGIELNKKENSNNFEGNNFLKEKNIDKPYMLYVGTISPHKNIKRMIEALIKLKKQGHSYQLVVAGKRGWLDDDIFDFVKNKNMENEVIFTGYVTDEEVEILYNNCVFSVFISLYEGFGLPPLESMFRNKPVLVSREASIPEVVGEAGFYCDAFDTEDIAKKMYELFTNESLRNFLVEKGKERVSMFTWDKTVKNTYAVYEKILKEFN